MRSDTVKIIECETKVAFPEDHFNPPLPPQTVVLTDRTAGDGDSIKPPYMVLENGVHRPMTREEVRREGVTADDVANSDPGKAGL